MPLSFQDKIQPIIKTSAGSTGLSFADKIQVSDQSKQPFQIVGSHFFNPTNPDFLRFQDTSNTGTISGNIASTLKSVSNLATFPLRTLAATTVRIPLELYRLGQESQQGGTNPVSNLAQGVGQTAMDIAKPFVFVGSALQGLFQRGIKKATGYDIGIPQAEQALSTVIEHLSNQKTADLTKVMEFVHKTAVERPEDILLAADQINAGLTKLTGTPTDIVSSMARPVTGAIKATTGAVGGGVEKVATALETSAVGKLENAYVKQASQTATPRNTLAESTARGKNDAAFLAERGIRPVVENGKVSTEEQANTMRGPLVAPLEAKLDEGLRIVDRQAPPVPIKTLEDRAIADLKAQPNIEAEARANIINRIKSKTAALSEQQGGGTISRVDLNIEKGNYYRGTRFDITDPLGINVKANKALGLAAKSVIENEANQAGLTTIKALNNEIGNYYSAADFLDSLNGTTVRFGKLGNYVFSVIGSSLGHTLPGKVIGFLGGNLVADLLKKSAFSNPLRSAILDRIKTEMPASYDATVKWIADQEALQSSRLALPSPPIKGSPTNPLITSNVQGTPNAPIRGGEVGGMRQRIAPKIETYQDLRNEFRKQNEPIPAWLNNNPEGRYPLKTPLGNTEVQTQAPTIPIIKDTNISPTSTILPKDLQSLAQEAKKYSTANEFLQALQETGKNEQLYQWEKLRTGKEYPDRGWFDIGRDFWKENVPKTIPKGLEPLAVEARKYKSAEEFVNSQVKLFRGDSGGNLGAGTDLKKLASRPQGLSTTIDENKARKFMQGKNIGSPDIFKDTARLDSFGLKPNAKVLDSRTLSKGFEKVDSQGEKYIHENDLKTIKYARENGYDAIDFSNDTRKLGGKEKEIIILNPDALLTKSQLTDIYNQATKKPTSEPLAQEARKYKSAEEFVKANQTKELNKNKNLNFGSTENKNVFKSSEVAGKNTALNDIERNLNPKKIEIREHNKGTYWEDYYNAYNKTIVEWNKTKSQLTDFYNQVTQAPISATKKLPRSVGDLVKAYNDTGRVAFRYPRKGQISLNGISYLEKEAIGRIKETLSATKEVTKQPPEGLTIAPSQAKTPQETLNEATAVFGKEKIGASKFPQGLKPFATEATYAKVPIGKTQIKTILINSSEFRISPVLTVNAEKNFEFIGKNTQFKIKPETMGLNKANLQVGDKIIVDRQAFKEAKTAQQLRIYRGDKTVGSIPLGTLLGATVIPVAGVIGTAVAGTMLNTAGQKAEKTYDMKFPKGFLQAVRDQESSNNIDKNNLALSMGISPTVEKTLGKDFKPNTSLQNVFDNATNFLAKKSTFIKSDGTKIDLTKPEYVVKWYVQKYVGLLPGQSRIINGQKVTYQEIYDSFKEKLDKYK